MNVRGPADDRARIGTAGWAIPSRHSGAFPLAGSHLQRYAACLDAAEINSSFHRPHRRSTYERWSASVPEPFRFSVKLPKTITHERRLVDCGDLIARFIAESEGLGSKLGPLLVQLPPSLEFNGDVAGRFFAHLSDRTAAVVVCEPRHASWFATEAEALLIHHRVARVAANPARVPAAGEPGGWSGLVYRRLHGSPTIYVSDYDAAALAHVRQQLDADRSGGAAVWCIFDNTTLGHALGNALSIAGGSMRPSGPDRTSA